MSLNKTMAVIGSVAAIGSIGIAPALNITAADSTQSMSQEELNHAAVQQKVADFNAKLMAKGSSYQQSLDAWKASSANIPGLTIKFGQVIPMTPAGLQEVTSQDTLKSADEKTDQNVSLYNASLEKFEGDWATQLSNLESQTADFANKVVAFQGEMDQYDTDLALWNAYQNAINNGEEWNAPVPVQPTKPVAPTAEIVYPIYSFELLPSIPDVLAEDEATPETPEEKPETEKPEVEQGQTDKDKPADVKPNPEQATSPTGNLPKTSAQKHSEDVAAALSTSVGAMLAMTAGVVSLKKYLN